MRTPCLVVAVTVPFLLTPGVAFADINSRTEYALDLSKPIAELLRA